MTPFHKEIGRQQEQERHSKYRNTAADRLSRRFGFVSTAKMFVLFPIAFDTTVMSGQHKLRPVKVMPFLIHTN